MENTITHLVSNATTLGDGVITDNPVQVAQLLFLQKAMSHVMYKIGEGINKSYFPILVPVGVIGNLLSFLVMIQKHNRHMSFSLYISVLAVTDTVTLFIGFVRYLNQVLEVDMPPDQAWHCGIIVWGLLSSTTSSTFIIVNMTFDRFYSIIRPHKAASFNTVKRAKVTMACIILLAVVWNVPHLFVTGSTGRSCVPYEDGIKQLIVEVHYWFSFTINFVVPFVLLLLMNSVIINTLRNRTKFVRTDSQYKGQGHSQGHTQGQAGPKIKNSEKQIYITLLLVTFGFLVFTTPSYLFIVYEMVYDYSQSPESFAGFYLYYQVSQKMLYSNSGINFFLYVMSGHKFRSDLVNLFRCNRDRQPYQHEGSPNSNSTVVSTVTESPKW